MENKENDQVLDLLEELGFKLEDIGNGYYGFQTGVANLIYKKMDDPSLLRLLLPGVVSLDEVSQLAILNAIQGTNSNIKYVKAYMNGKYCEISYERFVDDWETGHLREILAHMIDTLCYAKLYSHDLLTQYAKEEQDDDVNHDDDNNDASTSSATNNNENNND